MKNEVIFNKSMLNKAMLNKTILNKAIIRDVASATPEASPAQSDLWRRARACWERILRFSRRAPRRLRLCESLPLGERRFVAVVEFERSRFLVGGTSASLVLLARLETATDKIAPSSNPPTEISAGPQS
jgi:hypothetical protein